MCPGVWPARGVRMRGRAEGCPSASLPAACHAAMSPAEDARPDASPTSCFHPPQTTATPSTPRAKKISLSGQRWVGLGWKRDKVRLAAEQEGRANLRLPSLSVHARLPSSSYSHPSSHTHVHPRLDSLLLLCTLPGLPPSARYRGEAMLRL